MRLHLKHSIPITLCPMIFAFSDLSVIFPLSLVSIRCLRSALFSFLSNDFFMVVPPILPILERLKTDTIQYVSRCTRRLRGKRFSLLALLMFPCIIRLALGMFANSTNDRVPCPSILTVKYIPFFQGFNCMNNGLPLFIRHFIRLVIPFFQCNCHGSVPLSCHVILFYL